MTILTTLDRYLIKQFMPIFFVASAMFMLLVSLIELFAYLVRFLSFEVPFAQIMKVSLFYLPKSFSYALPVALLFASAYTLGDLYARNELTSIFSSGIPFWRFSMPLLVIGFVASFFSFFFDDAIVIPTLRTKNEMTRMLLHTISNSESNSDIVIKTRGGRIIYAVDYYDSSNKVLNGLGIVELDPDGRYISWVRAQRASWNGTNWDLVNPVIYQWEGGFLRIRALDQVTTYREDPETFRRSAVKVEELPVRDAGMLVKDLRTAGLPFVKQLSEYHHRFSFCTVSFVVMILSISMGGRFRKNIMLMSLLSSLGTAVVFYVMEMISMMMAKEGYIHPFVGAWFPVLSFIAIGILLLRSAKT